MSWKRRDFLAASAAMTASPSIADSLLAESITTSSSNDLAIAPFRFDVSPPLGHSLCGGWIKPVVAYDDSLEAIGYVLVSPGKKPIVVCVVDWTGLLNDAHVEWRKALAEAAGTTPDRVAVQCVHQHNAPFACLNAQAIVAQYKELPAIIDVNFYKKCLDRGQNAIRTAMKKLEPVTHIAAGEGRVEKVASNRRIIGANGKVRSQRGSSSKNPEHHRLPDGLIDPMLKTVAFYSGKKRVVACHYYACHPMSYYGDGRVSSDFAGLARKQRQKEDPNCTHLYFNGCGGNIGAGKYNNGTKPLRKVLTERIHAGLLKSEATLKPEPVEAVRWATHPFLPPADPSRYDVDAISKQVAKSTNAVVSRNRPSYTLAYFARMKRDSPIILSGLHINKVSMLHFPSECFIEYQLRAQKLQPNRFVAVAAYGDGGPWYIPTKDAYPQGGYAVSVAWAKPEVDGLLTNGMKSLLKV